MKGRASKLLLAFLLVLGAVGMASAACAATNLDVTPLAQDTYTNTASITVTLSGDLVGVTPNVTANNTAVTCANATGNSYLCSGFSALTSGSIVSIHVNADNGLGCAWEIDVTVTAYAACDGSIQLEVDKSVSADFATDLGAADIDITLVKIQPGDLIFTPSKCVFKSGSTYTCSGLPIGANKITVSYDKNGCSTSDDITITVVAGPNPCSDPTTCVGGISTCKILPDGKSFTCSCPTGYTGDGKTKGTGCTDIDECTTVTAPCKGVIGSFTCKNEVGSYQCVCANGYYNFAGTICVSIPDPPIDINVGGKTITVVLQPISLSTDPDGIGKVMQVQIWWGQPAVALDAAVVLKQKLVADGKPTDVAYIVYMIREVPARRRSLLATKKVMDAYKVTSTTIEDVKGISAETPLNILLDQGSIASSGGGGSSSGPGTPFVSVSQGSVSKVSTVPKTAVTVTISPKSDKMCISNTATCTAFEAFASPKPWTLADGEGPKTVYVWLQDTAGKTSASPGTATVTLSGKSGLVGFKTSSLVATNKVDLVVTANAAQMCVTDRTVTVPKRCPKWETYQSAKTLVLAGQGKRNIVAYFRNTKTDTPWGPATATALSDRTVPKMVPKSIGLAGKYSGTTFTVSFNAGATDDVSKTIIGSGVKDYVLVYSQTRTPAAYCGSKLRSSAVKDTTLPITMSPDLKTGSASLTIATSTLVKKTRFRLCARDNVDNYHGGLVLVGKP